MSERDLQRLMKLVAKALGAEWVDLSDWLRSLPENDIAQIEARIAGGRMTQWLASSDQAALRFAAETHGRYVQSAERAAKWLDAQPSMTEKLIRFDQADDLVVRRARMNQLQSVHGFREEANEIAQQVTHRALVEGSRTGINPRRMARDFRNSIGLAPVQEEWVANYQRALEEGRYGDAMRREMHDDRSNRMLHRLKRDKETLTEGQIQTMVDRYRKNMVGYRAETIARTASSENVHLGIKDAFNQAIARGDVDADLLVKEWHSRPRRKGAREMHQAMNGVTVKWDEDFVLPDGVRMAHPGDERGGAKHNASCGCTSSTTLNA